MAKGDDPRRSPGGKTQSQRDIFVLCREKTPAAIERVLWLMTHAKDQRVQLDAAKVILDRGLGKVPAVVRIEGEGKERTPLEEALLAAARPVSALPSSGDAKSVEPTEVWDVDAESAD